MSWKLQSNPILTNIVLEAVLTQANIEHLDDGLPEKARESLMLILDGQILKIATLMETTAAEKDREIGKQFLHRVAKHRNKYPATYPDWAEATGVTKTKDFVTEILKSVKTEDH